MIYQVKNRLLLWFFRKTWSIRIRHVEGFILVEVTDPSFVWASSRNLYLQLIDSIMRQYKTIAISQTIDQTQWNIGAQDKFLDKIRREFSVPAVMTATYDDARLPKWADDCFVLHTIGPYERALIQEVVHFGMVSLPNILYGLKQTLDSWPAHIFEWNKLVVKWFELKTPDSGLLQIIEQVGLICFTVDGHLFFGFLNDDELQEFLVSAKRVARENSLDIVIERTREAVKTERQSE